MEIMVKTRHPRRQGLGEIYFIKVGDFYKVGATRDLYGRLHTIQVCNALECTLIHRVKTNDMRLTERLFKSRYGRLSMRGEWFNLSDADIAYIRQGVYSKAIMDSIGNTDEWTRVPEVIGRLLAGCAQVRVYI